MLVTRRLSNFIVYRNLIIDYFVWFFRDIKEASDSILELTRMAFCFPLNFTRFTFRNLATSLLGHKITILSKVGL